MYKYRFFNDYSEGAHPAVLELLNGSNADQEEGYGLDTICLKAEALLKQTIGNPQAAVHFISSGTQANLIALAAMLRPYESVIAASSAHINVHEAGAVEATGHKINGVPSGDGKLTAEKIQAVVDEHSDEHMVKPRVVFISNSTEVGTVYSKRELESISRTCRANQLYLYLDGARLGSALVSRDVDFTLADLCRLVDMFYIGGTKNGALLGEAMVINTPELQRDFRFHLKQRGALLAKGRLLGIQFLGLFADGLYFELARHANAMAAKLAQAIRDQGYDFLSPPATNQIFPILPEGVAARLQEQYGFYTWVKAGPGLCGVRLVTSWATPEAKVDEFIRDLKQAAG